MFPEPARPAVQTSQHLANLWPVGRVSYSDYRPKKRVQCTECVWVVHETRLATGKMGGTLIGTARYRRKWDGGELLLCNTHASIWKERDGKS